MIKVTIPESPAMPPQTKPEYIIVSIKSLIIYIPPFLYAVFLQKPFLKGFRISFVKNDLDELFGNA